MRPHILSDLHIAIANSRIKKLDNGMVSFKPLRTNRARLCPECGWIKDFKISHKK